MRWTTKTGRKRLRKLLGSPIGPDGPAVFGGGDMRDLLNALEAEEDKCSLQFGMRVEPDGRSGAVLRFAERQGEMYFCVVVGDKVALSLSLKAYGNCLALYVPEPISEVPERPGHRIMRFPVAPR